MDYEPETIISYKTVYGYTQEPGPEHLIRAFTVVICMLIGVAGNLTLVYIIFRYKSLRTLTNIVLANWAIADAGFLLSSSRLLDLIVYFTRLDLTPTQACIEFQLEQSFAIAANAFLDWMCIDWCLGAYWPDKQAWFRKHCKVLLGIIWSGVVCWAVKVTILCRPRTHLDYDDLLHLFNTLLLLIVVITMHVMHAVQKFKQNVPKQSSLMKTIGTVLMLTWLTYYITYMWLRSGAFFIQGIISGVLYLKSVMVILVLLKFHEGFRTRCSSSPTDDSSEEHTVDQNAHVELDFN